MKPEESATTGADLLVKALIDEEVEVVFGYPGGAVLPIYDSLFKQNRLRHILVRHEQAAVHAAEGYARSTGKVGVVLVTSGPGRHQRRHRPHRRADGFDPDGLPDRPGADPSDRQRRLPGSRHHGHHPALHQAQLSREGRRDLARIVHEAFYVARSGRPGPVVIDLPKDVLMNKHDYCGAQEAGAAQELPPAGQARAREDRAGDRADRQCQEAGLLHRRRRDQFRPEGVQAARPVRAHDGLSHHQHPDGPRRVSRRRTSSSSACWACTAPTKPTSRCITATC